MKKKKNSKRMYCTYLQENLNITAEITNKQVQMRNNENDHKSLQLTYCKNASYL